MFMRTLAVAVLACALSGSPARAEDFSAPVGPHRVGGPARIVLHDAERGKDLLVEAHYPEAEDGPWPVVIFSHGAGGSGPGVRPLTQYWASHGYLCLAPTHEDSLSLRQGADRDRLFSPEGVDRRAADISFLIDALPTLARKLPDMPGRPDPDRVGVGGHSYGAFTAMVIGGATVRRPDGEKSYADERADALLALSGQGPGRGGLHEESWQDFDRPLMSVTGSLDGGMGGETPEWRRRNYELSPEGDKYLVWIEGARHSTFVGKAGDRGKLTEEQKAALRERLKKRFGGRYSDRQINRFIERRARRREAPDGLGDEEAIFEWVKTATLAYWNAYLKQDEEARAYLKSEALPRASGGELALERK
jgi:predicted dienelactone hydrolase